MVSSMTDARIVRTRASLRAAILELASQKPVTEITISELAAVANINRVTFYKHYASPAEALGEALQSELDLAREAALAEQDPGGCNGPKALIHGLDVLLDHVKRHRRLYELSMTAKDDGAVPWALSEHFSETIKLFLQRRAADLHCTGDYDLDIVAGFFGAGLVGAVYTWLQSGDRDTAPLIESVTRVLPTWWFPSEDRTEL